MRESDIATLVTFLSVNPMAGDVIQGTGGCRKVRVAGKQKGKSGGFRTITFFSGEMMPVFLITVLAKNERANLSQAERNGLGTITQQIVAEYQNKIVKVSIK